MRVFFNSYHFSSLLVLELFRRALAIKEVELGSSHTSTGITVDRLALLLEKREQLEEAEVRRCPINQILLSN
jgi:hypothetical protein